MWTFHDIPGQLQPGKKSSGFINPGVTFRKHSPNCSHSQHRSPNSFSATATASTACKGTPRVEQLLKGSSTPLHRQMRPKGRGLGAEMFFTCGDDGKSGLRPWKIPTIPIYPIILYKIPSFTLGETYRCAKPGWFPARKMIYKYIVGKHHIYESMIIYVSLREVVVMTLFSIAFQPLPRSPLRCWESWLWLWSVPLVAWQGHHQGLGGSDVDRQ